MDSIAKAERIAKSKFSLIICLIVAVISLSGACVYLFVSLNNANAKCDEKLDKQRDLYEAKLDKKDREIYECQQSSKIKDQLAMQAERENNKKLEELWGEVSYALSKVKSQN